MGDRDCLFCQIVAGTAPSSEVLANDQVYAFRDIHPGAPVHVLVVPRVHVRDASSVTSEHGPLLAALLEGAQQAAEAEGVAESGYRLVFNVGDDASNSVGHLHLHLLGGRKLEWPPG